MAIRLKRAYEPRAKSDGQRILVERLWPRGFTKERLAVDHWMKDVAPSPGLRAWYGHDPAKWSDFKKRYRAELMANTDAVDRLRHLCRAGRITFVFAAKDEVRNSAAILKAFFEQHG